MLCKLNLLIMSRRLCLLVYILRWHHRVCLRILLSRLLIWIYRTRIGWFTSISIHEIGKQSYIRLILKQVVIQLFFQELCKNVKLILVSFIHIFIPKFRNNLHSLKLFYIYLKCLEEIFEVEYRCNDLWYASSDMCWKTSAFIIGWPVLRWLEYNLLQEIKLDYDLIIHKIRKNVICYRIDFQKLAKFDEFDCREWMTSILRE